MDIHVVFLIKFGEKANIERLLTKGEIYMNTIQWFKNYEKKGIGDIYEGTTEIKNIVNGKFTLQIPNNPIVLNPASLQIRKHYAGHIGNIYSTYAISNLLLQRKNLHRIDKRMENFGSHCLIIKDLKAFTEAIFEKLNEMNYKYSHNIVTYKNFKRNDHEITLFDKSHLLSYQKEHRILAWTDKAEPIKFEIGSLENYAEMHSSAELIKSLTVDFNKH